MPLTVPRLPGIHVCRRKVRHQVRAWGARIHLVYFASIVAAPHGPSYVLAAGGCLAIGVLAEIVGDELDG